MNSEGTKYHGSFKDFSEEEKDKVINPTYYKDKVPGYEYMQLMEHLLLRIKDPVVAHLLGLVYKYLLRFGDKDDELQDATKISWYSSYLVGYLTRKAKGETPYKPGLPEEEKDNDILPALWSKGTTT